MIRSSPAFRNEIWHDRQHLGDDADGSLAMTLPAANLTAIKKKVLKYGRHVVVMTPEELDWMNRHRGNSAPSVPCGGEKLMVFHAGFAMGDRLGTEKMVTRAFGRNGASRKHRGNYVKACAHDSYSHNVLHLFCSGILMYFTSFRY